MRKSKFFSMVFMVCFFALIAISALLALTYWSKMREWSSVGETVIWEGDPAVQVTIRRDPAYKNTDTREYSNSTYRRYVFGRTVTGDKITDSILSDPKAEIRYDGDGNVIEVFFPPEGKAAPFRAEEFLMKYAQKRWCLIPTMEAAIFASWIWFLKWIIGVGLIVSFVGWRVAHAISKRPLRDRPERGLGRRTRAYKGGPIQRLSNWIRTLRDPRRGRR